MRNAGAPVSRPYCSLPFYKTCSPLYHHLSLPQRMYADLEAVVLAINGDRAAIRRHLAAQRPSRPGSGSSSSSSSNEVLEFAQPLNICMKLDLDAAVEEAAALRGELGRAAHAGGFDSHLYASLSVPHFSLFSGPALSPFITISVSLY